MKKVILNFEGEQYEMTTDEAPEQGASELNGLLCCDDCGEAKEDVVHTNCPYAEEITGSIQPANLCGDCYHERCMDI